MVDLKLLKEKDITAEAWEPKLKKLHLDYTHLYTSDFKEPTNDEERLQSLHCRLRSRVQAGISYNLENYMTTYLMDLVWDTPKRSVSPTLLQNLATTGKTDEQLLNILKSFGYDLKSLVQDLEKKDEKTGKSKPTLNVPAFMNVTVPLVRAYLTARKARIVNDHNLDPFIQYKPLINTPDQRLRAEIHTKASEQQARWFNYPNLLDQAVHRMLLYPTGGILMPREDWFTEEQLKKVNGEEKEVIVREGIRYHCPHPSRVYYDQAYPIRDINTDTGPRWIGYWKVSRFKDIKDNENFYNTDRIYPGRAEWWQSASNFFATVYSTCTLNVAKPSEDLLKNDVNDRESWLANNFHYNNSYMDSSVVLVEHYEKINPKRDGLGDYDYDIWARFVMAGDGTIVYAQPVGYVPGIAFKDNGDDSRLEEVSQGQAMIPYQDQIQNLLVQYLLSVKQNLANLTLVDKNVVEQKWIDKITNWGERFFRSLNIIPADLKGLSTLGQHNVQSAVTSWRFPFLDTNGILQAIRTVLDLAERVLGFSAQEVGQAATHEQTQDEIHLIASSMDNLLRYTSIPVDQAMYAWGNQLYEARMNYGSKDFYAGLPSKIELTDAKLKEMGITVVEKAVNPGDSNRVKVDMSAIEMESFATVPPTYRRITNNAIVRDLTMFFRDIMNNGVIQQAIGPDQALAIVNSIAELAELPMPAKLENVGMDQQQEIMQILEQNLGQFRDEIKQALEVLGTGVQKNSQSIQLLARSLNIQLPNGNNAAPPEQGQSQPAQTVA